MSMPPPLPRQDDEDAEAADPAADLAHRHPAGGTGTPPIDDIGGLVASLVLHRFSRLTWIHRSGRWVAGSASTRNASWAGSLLMSYVNVLTRTGGTFRVCIFAQIRPAGSDL